LATSDSANGIIDLNTAADTVTALCMARPGRGLGEVLLGHTRAGCSRLVLWTFLSDTGAHRFCAREDFRKLLQTPGDDEESLPDVLLQWERARG